MLQTLARQIAVAIHDAIANRKITKWKTTEAALMESQRQLEASYLREQKRRRLSDTLREVAKILNSNLNLDILLNEIMRQLAQVIECDSAAIFLPKGDRLVISSGTALRGVDVGYYVLLESQDPAAQVFRNKQCLIIPDVHQDPYWLMVPEGKDIRTWMGVPLLIKEQSIGILTIDSFAVAAFQKEDAQVLQFFADQASIAIENARLFKAAQQEVLERKNAELAVQFANAELNERTEELEEAIEQTELALREQQRAEEALQVANTELLKMNADKDKFFSIVAHDLRGPFQPLLGLSKFMVESAQDLSPADVEEMSGSIYRSAKNVYNLLENLLEWSRLQRGRIEYQPTKLNLWQLAEQNVDLLAVNAENKGVVLKNEIPTDIFVYADANMLDTVIRNLISNALKFTPKDERVTLGAELRDNLVEVWVMDTGIGISQENVNKLFKIEVHHTTRGTKNEQGSGLGLIICKEMVEKNGGRIWIESELGKGTTVKFTVSDCGEVQK